MPTNPSSPGAPSAVAPSSQALSDDSSGHGTPGRPIDGEAYASEHSARVAAEAAVFIRDRVLSIVSHDLRGPLNAIHSWAHVLERKLNSDDPGVARAIAGIRTGVEQQVKLIEDVIDKTRASTRNLALSLANVSLAPIVGAEIENIRSGLARQQSVTVNSHLSLDGIHATMDAERFGQAVWTILAYAIEAAEPGGTIDVDGHAESGRIEVSVAFTAALVGDPNAALAPTTKLFGNSPASLDNGALPLALPTRVAAAHGGDLSNEVLADGRRRIAIRQPAHATH